jgi:hypothetical protein
MTPYERQCMRELRQELEIEIGVPRENPGRRAILTLEQARIARTLVRAAPRGEKLAVTEELMRVLRVSHTTIWRAIVKIEMNEDFDIPEKLTSPR